MHVHTHTLKQNKQRKTKTCPGTLYSACEEGQELPGSLMLWLSLEEDMKYMEKCGTERESTLPKHPAEQTRYSLVRKPKHTLRLHSEDLSENTQQRVTEVYTCQTQV